ncbi:MAG: hypothetical protein KF836_12805 [Fimbriimonadaceae bacterium]|nr:hypothetical protein [Fimbriimonadaceae bacterium]
MTRKRLALFGGLSILTLAGMWVLTYIGGNTTCEGRSFLVGATELKLKLDSSDEFGCHYTVPKGVDIESWLKKHGYEMKGIGCGPISSTGDFSNKTNFVSVTYSEIGKDTKMTVPNQVQSLKEAFQR